MSTDKKQRKRGKTAVASKTQLHQQRNHKNKDKYDKTKRLQKKIQSRMSEVSGANSQELGVRRPASEQKEEQVAVVNAEKQMVMIPLDTIAYFKRAEALLAANAFEGGDEERALLVQSALQEANGSESRLSCHNECSRALETLLRAASPLSLRIFCDRLNGSFDNLLRHRFASHVVQTLFTLAAAVVDDEMQGIVAQLPNPSLGSLPTMTELILDVCQQLRPFVAELMADPYASHVLRVLILLLSGAPFDSDLVRSKGSQKYRAEHDQQSHLTAPAPKSLEKRQVPATFPIALRDLTKAMLDGCNNDYWRRMAQNEMASPTMQLLMKAHANNNDSASVYDMIAKLLWSLPDPTLQPDDARKATLFMDQLAKDRIGSHCLEVIFQSSSSEIFMQLYTRHIRSSLDAYCLHPVANFVVAQLLGSVKNGRQLRVLLNDLLPSCPILIQQRKTGILVKAMEAALRVKDCFDLIQKALFAAFHLTEKVEKSAPLFRLALFCKPLHQFDANDRDIPIQAQGAHLIEKWVQLPQEFSKSLISSLVALDLSLLQHWVCHSVASHAIESVLQSETIPPGMKMQLVRRFMGHFVALAGDKYGSHVLDCCWGVADASMRQSIAEEFIKRQSEMDASHYGRIIWRNCRMDEYRRQQGDWIAKEKAHERKKRFFSDLLDEKEVLPLEKKLKKKKQAPVATALHEIDQIFNELDAPVNSNKKSKK